MATAFFYTEMKGGDVMTIGWNKATLEQKREVKDNKRDI